MMYSRGRPTANATQMLEGVVPNLNISLSDGKPGRTADFNVRGAGSINGGSALVLIDGVEGDPSMLNPNDIESISVLKVLPLPLFMAHVLHLAWF